MDQEVFDLVGSFALANGLVACTGFIGVGLIGFLAWRARNSGLLFAGLGFAFLACANLGFAGQIITAIIVGLEVSNDQGQTFVELLMKMNCAFTVMAAVAVVSLILGFWYTYRRFLPSWQELTEGSHGLL